ncbi:hypothetical protein GYB22_10320 [bacterium]|nr:hypothetical protein [bacterium]
MRVVILALGLICGFLAQAQDTELEEHELHIGDTLYFTGCEGSSFEYIDLYVKTRFAIDSISYDTLNGWDFYNRFFPTGDFDMSRLPCEYEGRYGIIKHMMSVEDADGIWHNIVIAMIVDGTSVAYIVEDAFIEGEVLFSPAQ